jgi:beta-galactosidase/beta-glucuronidase
MRAGRERTQTLNTLSTIWSDSSDSDIPLSEYPRPQLCRRDWICLNGYWHYAFTETSGRPEQFDGKILVPFSPEASRSGVNRRLDPGKYLWYFRTVNLPEIPEGKRLLLHFGAVDERCIVWWNGRLLGSHLGGYLPFSFDVTEQIRAGKNTLWVRVQDDTDQGTAARGKQKLKPGGMFYTAQSGIWQTVWMEWVPEHYVEGIRITPLFAEGRVRLEVLLSHPKETDVIIQGVMTSYQHHIRAEEFQWCADERGHLTDRTLSRWASVVMELDLPECHPWSPEDPFLYDLVVLAGEDQVSSYFALREFSVGRDSSGHPRLMLNGSPCFFNGVLDQGYWPESLYTPPADEAMIYDIETMKRLGFNMIRKHLKVEPLRWYYHCDRLGMVVWQDMVNGGGSINQVLMTYLPNAFPMLSDKIHDRHYRLFSRADGTARAQWQNHCFATVDHLYNSPCIGLWVLFNEGWGQFDALKLTEQIRRQDPTRLIDHASGWFDQGGGDVKSVHNYFRRLRVQKGDRPFVLSEYGGYSCCVPGHTCSSHSYGYKSFRTTGSFAAAYKKLQKKVHQLEKKGLSAAVYTQLSDIEEEINGLLTYDRRTTKI